MSQSDGIIGKIDALRRGNKDFVTNSFFPAQQLKSLVDSGNTTAKASNEAVIILLEEERLTRLYFYAASFDSLRHIPLLMPEYKNKAVIADIVGKNHHAAKLAAGVEEHNFSKYRELIRMNRKNEEVMQGTVSDVILAGSDDIDEIMDILYGEFDIFVSRLPTRQKLQEAVTKGGITVVRQLGKIAGLAYFEKPGERLKYLYQIAVHRDFRGKGVADELLKHEFVNTPMGTIFQLWVEADNKYALNKYREYGFIPDGLVDYIMLYKENGNG